MSIPAFGWAMQRGRELGLSPGLRMLLIAIADRQNGDAYCTASQACLANDTGLTVRRVRDLAPELARLGLISIEPIGRFLRYQVQRPIAEAVSGVRRATEEMASAKQRQPLPVSAANKPRHSGNGSTRHRKSVPQNAETVSDKPYNQEDNLKSARETHAAAAAAPDGRSGGDVLPATKAPFMGGTTDGSLPVNALITPKPKPPDPPPEPQSLEAYCDELRRKREAEEAEWDRRMAETAAAGPVQRRESGGKPMLMQAYAPGRLPVRSRSEMLDELRERPAIKPLYAPDPELVVARAELAARAAAISATREARA